MHLAIRADGGPNIGYGHLVRTGALAEYALKNGNCVTYATRTPEHTHETCPQGVNIVALDAEQPHAAFLEWLSNARPDCVLTDSYEVDTADQRAITEMVPRLAVVLDDTRFAICADVLINGNVYAPDLEYEWVGFEPEWCPGTDFLLLRERIRGLANSCPPWRPNPERALVTMGGSDVENLTPLIIRAFDGLDVEVDAIAGPGFDTGQIGAIHEATDKVSNAVSVTRDPDDLPSRMFEADFAVSTASTTSYELLALGTPLICLPVADNQQPIATAFDDRDIATVLDRDADESVVYRALKTYATEPEIRRNRRKRGRSLVDAGGTERVAKELFSRT